MWELGFRLLEFAVAIGSWWLADGLQQLAGHIPRSFRKGETAKLISRLCWQLLCAPIMDALQSSETAETHGQKSFIHKQRAGPTLSCVSVCACRFWQLGNWTYVLKEDWMADKGLLTLGLNFQERKASFVDRAVKASGMGWGGGVELMHYSGWLPTCQ